MKRQKTEDRRQKSEGSERNPEDGIRFRARIALVCLLFSIFCPLAASGSDKWQGVDESVVQKIAKEHGREAHKPLINTDQGDLLLFVFLLAGVAGGFAAGYYWRKLTEHRQKE